MSSKQITLISLVLVCLIGVSPAAVPDPDVGWWRFDEGTGDTTADSSGKGHPGTIQGAGWVDGGWNGLGWCLDFDRQRRSVELGVIDVQAAASLWPPGSTGQLQYQRWPRDLQSQRVG
jgi:hypothetical protein